MSTDSGVYAFVDDLIDEGPAQVAERFAGQGFSTVTLAAVYHGARDLLPHNPRRAVAHRPEGGHYFTPDESLYTGALKPRRAPTAMLAEAVSAVVGAGLSWHAWTVYLHNGRLAIAHPTSAVANAFGDVYETDLCPSSEAAADYAAALTADVARLRPGLIVAESLHHAGFSHGAHHERAFVAVSPIADFLLSLCFCSDCRARAAGRGVDASALAARVRGVVRAELREPTTAAQSLDREALRQRCGAELLDYLSVRESTVTTLADRCATVARARGVGFGFIDQTGALKGYATGEPSGRTSCDDAWRLGIAPRDIAGVVDTYVTLAYAKSPARVGLEVRDYAASSSDTPLRCVLRHGGPDFTDATNLREKVQVARGTGADAVDFYHYGLMPLSGLEAASAAIRN